ncbi:MAG TPA: long-chain-fatty-acid--CoA ligase [Actinomycetota bacterium]|nr:long-chain-fatty-acid--CoA ligase [Actinomycetota bacterium]
MNLAALARENVEKFGEYAQVHFEGREYLNTEAVADADRMANVFHELGVRPGDRVAVMLPNSLEVYQSYGGILSAGAVVVPIVFLLAVPEVRHIVADCTPKVLVTSPEFHPNVLQAIEGLPEPPAMLVTGDAPDGARSFDALRDAATARFDLVDRGEDDVAVIMYTGGTTGRPKGVALSQRNIHWNATTIADTVGIHAGDVGLSALPVAHLFGMISSVTAQVIGVRGILLRWFTADGVLQAIQDHRVQFAPMVPTMMTYLLQEPSVEDFDLSSLEIVFASAAPVPIELAEAFEKRFHCEVVEAYGQTEAGPGITVERPGTRKKAGSAGLPFEGCEVRIEDDEHDVLPAGQLGEVCARGPGVMLGYYNLPDATADTLKHGWLHTGDMGFVDRDGYLFVTERKKDLIIRGGFNVYPRDVEELLNRHPAVAEAAVVGMPDPAMGEEVVAFVVRKPGAEVTEEEVLAFARQGLARYKVPKEIHFRAALPKSPIGKVLKKDLRAELAPPPSGEA